VDIGRIHCVWPYLPAFLAVAETQHLRRAARELHVSPSALSRSIRLLEERIGHPLFERHGRKLQLTAVGHHILEIVRESVRLVNEVLADSDLDDPTSEEIGDVLPRA
jgi:DNA-binding transcriptional LysR family regulator